jgi:hypothetical protein
VLRAACLVSGLSLAGPALAADVTGTCGKIDPAGTRIAVLQSRGHAVVTIAGQPSRHNALARVDYDDETYTGRFDDKGQAVIEFALVGTENKMTVRGPDFAPVHCDVAFPDIDHFYRVILRWHDPVRLDLHVVEPGRRLGGFGDIHAGARNPKKDKGLGEMDVVTDPGDPGMTGEQSYVLDEQTRPTDDAGYTFRVDYVSRAAHPDPRFCGSGPEASIPLSLIVLDKGRELGPREYEIAGIPCGQVVQDDQRAQRLR